MAIGALARVVGKALTRKKPSTEVSKRGTEVIGRRPEKDMGMAEEVKPKRIDGPKASEAKKTEKAEEAKKSSNRVGAKAAAGAAGVGAVGAGIGLSGGDKEDKKPTPSRESKGSVEDQRTSERKESPSAAAKESKASETKKPSTFGAAFKEARSAGKDTFTFNGKKYTTELASDKKATPKVQAGPRAIAAEDDATMRLSKGVREGRNPNIDDDTRKRAMASVLRLAKGGMVNCGASVPPAQKRK